MSGTNTVTETIVNINATQTYAPLPNTLQQQGAIVVEGATNLPVNTAQYVANMSQLNSLISSSGTGQQGLINSGTEFFSQGSAAGFSVLEIGPQASPGAMIAAVGSFIQNNPRSQYVYAMPGIGDGDAPAMAALANQYATAGSQVYFLNQLGDTTFLPTFAGIKSILAYLYAPNESPPSSFASVLYNMISNNPSTTQRVGPLAYRFLYNVEPWPQTSATQINAILQANGNLPTTAAEGGLSNVILQKGTCMDGTPFMTWFGVDWASINIKQNLAAWVINASNNGNPIFLNQKGINAGMAVIQGLLSTGVSYNLFSSATVTAVPFNIYQQQNPGLVAKGIYNGYSVTIVDIFNFNSITVNINSTQFAQ